MKRILLLTAVALFTILYGFSQTQMSLALSDSSGPFSNNSIRVKAGIPSEEIVYYCFVTNTSQNPLYVRVKKVELSILTGTINTFCWGLCYAPSVFLSPDSIVIQPGHTDSIDFSGHYTPGNVKGVSSLRYVFFNCANPTDSVCAVVQYSAYPLGIENPSYGINLSNAYPSPASTMVSFDYSGVNGSGAVLIIRNMLGSVVKEIRLEGGSGKMSIPVGDLNEGCYFYSLINNDKPVVTKRFVVLH